MERSTGKLFSMLLIVPHGSHNFPDRWAKISQAMDGRRTARQVASRVQKYFEKLKRFGVEVGTTNSGP